MMMVAAEVAILSLALIYLRQNLKTYGKIVLNVKWARCVPRLFYKQISLQ